jgi:hypothetical protein
MEAWTAGW